MKGRRKEKECDCEEMGTGWIKGMGKNKRGREGRESGNGKERKGKCAMEGINHRSHEEGEICVV